MLGGIKAEKEPSIGQRHKHQQQDQPPLPCKFVCFDFEWRTATATANSSTPASFVIIEAASFVDSNGLKKAFLIEDYNRTFGSDKKAEYALLVEIVNCLCKYHYSFGWYSKGFEFYNSRTKQIEGKNSDLVMLDKRLKAHGISSIVGFNKLGVPYIAGNGRGDNHYKHQHIDALKLYEKPMVKVGIFKNKYRSLGLDTVAKAVIGRGKYKGYSGKDFLFFSDSNNICRRSSGNNNNLQTIEEEEEKRKYVLEDSQLVYDILAHNNFQILKLMLAISNLTGTSFETVCNYGVSTLWTRILDAVPTVQKHLKFSLSNSEAEREETKVEDDDYNAGVIVKKNSIVKFEGGKVIEPIRGEHKNVYVFDVASLYPAMVINHNISFDTVNCACCQNAPSSQVSKDVTTVKNYWICTKRQGIFAERMMYFTQERLKHKKLGNDIESQGLKILINAGYGVFGYKYFKYYDPRVAELVTAFGRDTLTKMQRIAEGLGFAVLYGDTDSLFVNNVKSVYEVDKFIAECKSNLGVDVGHERTFSKLILAGKKHYIGIPSSDDTTKEPIIKGFEGIKSDRVEYVRNVFLQMIDDYKNNVNPVPKLKQAFSNLEQRSIQNPKQALLKSIELRKDPHDYANDCVQKRLGLELGLKRGDIVSFYLSDNNKQKYSFDVRQCSTRQYRTMLNNAVKDVLEILGYDSDLFLYEEEDKYERFEFDSAMSTTTTHTITITTATTPTTPASVSLFDII
jgi:DNA polymerase, archaea type